MLSIDKRTGFAYIALMEKPGSQVLVTPYTLMEEEATWWSLLLFGPLGFLHPYPLPFPEPYRKLLAEGLIRVQSPERTTEAIRQKEKRLREFQTFVSQNPDFSFLEYLKQVKPGKRLETRDEILDLLRGKPSKPQEVEDSREAPAGDLFLCIIHDWLNKQWEIDLSLDKFEEQELGLARIMDESPEFSSSWAASEKPFVAPSEAEMVCLPALAAWKELRAQLAPGPGLLISNQAWVRRIHYGSTLEDLPATGLPLPALHFPSSDSFLERYRSWSKAGILGTLRQRMEDRFSKQGATDQDASEFRESLDPLNLKGPGRYSLLLPPNALPLPAPEPLFLIAPAGIL